MLCTWNVTSSTGTFSINTTFFDLEGYSDDCVFDRLVIIKSDGTQARFCRNSGPSYVNVGSMATIHFISDLKVQRLGFQLSLLATLQPTTPAPVNPQCGHVYNLASSNDTTTLYSPGWPGVYPNDAYCNWTISNGLFNSNMGIKFKFIQFNIEDGYDVLQVTSNSSGSVSFSGMMPQNVTRIFNTSSVNIIFKSDGSVREPGFHIEATLVTNPFTCNMGQFKCKTSNQCIPGNKRCDQIRDCPDNSDESFSWCQMPNVCGKMIIQPNIFVPGEVLIVGGSEAKPGSWPWTVSLHYKASGHQFCGGTLISPHWLISAAHCFAGESGNPYQFIAKVGSFRDYNSDIPYEIDVGLEKIWIHPKYDHKAETYDISVVRLITDVPFNGKFNNHTGVACLPQPDYQVPAGTNCVITGWGDTKHTGSNKILRQAIVPIVSTDICNSTQEYHGEISDTMICAGYKQGGKDTCQGDSGGPLVCRDPITRNWVLQGITSWGKGCALPSYPGVYSRASKLIQFAFDIINLND